MEAEIKSGDVNSVICPACQTANREIARFCKECGRFLAGTCPNCGSSTPEAARYCDICGYRLSQQPLQAAVREPAPARGDDLQRPAPSQPLPRVSRLQQYIPQELLAKLEAAQASGGMAGERRVVTMLFCDVSGSTAAAEQLDPEDWAGIINGAFEHMIAPVYRYEGTVARLMGDGILAFFGAPISHEDDPQRAVLAGLDIVSACQDYGRGVFERFGIEFNVRVGINTGRVVVGAVGSDLRLEYSALGDAINVAARMEQSARPGTVQIAEDTYKLVAPLFEFEPLGGVTVKGKGEPIRAYRVLAQKAEPGSLRGLSGLASPLVGRMQDLQQLQKGLDDLAQGHGRILFLIGQAGLGKSRLLREARKMGDHTGSSGPVHFLTHRQATSYKASEAYSMLKGVVQLLFELNGGPPAEKRQILRRGVASLPNPEEAFLAFAGLLGLLEEGDGPALQGEAFKRHLYASTREVVQNRAGGRPLAMVMDDLHWADPVSVEMIEGLFQLSDSSAILFLCAMRPDRQAAGWNLKVEAEKEFPHRISEIDLQPLDESESNELLDGILPGAPFPNRLRSLILDRAEGNPFFIEEVVRTLIDDGHLRAVGEGSGGPSWQVIGQVETVEVPGNLQGLLAARLDRLDEACRKILQMASVIGRFFDYPVLARVVQEADDLDQYLALLQRFELIVEVSRLPERRYAFRNTLMQEAVYKTMLRSQRREYHRQTAEAILALLDGQVNDEAPMLAHHFFQAGDRRAVAHSRMAADAAYNLYANKEAATFYGAALEMLGPDFDHDPTELTHLFARRGRALELESQFGQALANYREMERVARRREDRAMELAALLSQGTIFSTANERFNSKSAEELASRTLDLAQELDDGPAEAKIYWNLLNVYRLTHKLDDALVAGEKALAIARRLDLREQLAFVANDMAHVYYPAGYYEKAEQVIDEAVGLWRELDNQPMLADGLATAALYLTFAGAFDQAIALSDEAYEISRKIDNLWGQSYSRYAIGMVYWQQGKPDKALETMEACIRLGEQAGFLPAQLFGSTYLSLCYAQLGQIERGLQLARKTVKLSGTTMALYQSHAQGYLGQILLLAGEIEEAERVFDQLIEMGPSPDPLFDAFVEESLAIYALTREDYGAAIERSADYLAATRRLNLSPMRPHALTIHGQALLGASRLEEAREHLQAARDEAEELGARWQLWRALAALAEVEEAGGDPAADVERLPQAKAPVAGELRRQAREIVLEIADRLPTQEYRDSFLETAAVIKVLS